MTQQTASTPNGQPNTGPLIKLRSGSIHVTVWENTSKNGQTYITAKVERRFEDKAAGVWKSSNSFHLDEMPVVANLMARATTEIEKRNAAN